MFILKSSFPFRNRGFFNSFIICIFATLKPIVYRKFKIVKYNMLLLHIETSTNVCSVALSENLDCIYFKSNADGMNHAALLSVFIAEALNRPHHAAILWKELPEGSKRLISRVTNPPSVSSTNLLLIEKIAQIILRIRVR